MLPPLAHLEAGEALDHDPFAGLGVHAVDELAYLGLTGGVFDEGLFEQTLIGEELLQLALDDFIDHLGGLLLVGQLAAIDLALLLDHVARDVLPRDIRRVRRRDLHPEILHQLLKGVRARHEVGLAVDLDENAQLAAVMDVRPDGALAGLPVRSFARLGQPLLAEELDGGLQILLGRLACLLEVHHARASPIGELFAQLRGRRGAQASPPAAATSSRRGARSKATARGRARVLMPTRALCRFSPSRSSQSASLFGTRSYSPVSSISSSSSSRVIDFRIVAKFVRVPPRQRWL